MTDNRIKVIDSYMGSGKTSYAIQYINSLPAEINVIYITPYLEEVNRIIAACVDREFKQPDARSGQGSKLRHLIQLVNKRINIVSTHALFMNINDELINALRINDYILILDEVFQTVNHYDIVGGKTKKEVKEEITKQDVNTLLKTNLIKVEKDFRVSWNDHDEYLSQYEGMIEMMNRGLIYFVNGSLLLWSFPIEVFRPGIFREIYILTYRFESQLQYYYYKYFDLQYTKYIVRKYDSTRAYYIEENDGTDEEWKQQIKKCIDVVENEKLNKIGDVYYDYMNRPIKSTLSKTWYEKNPDMLPVMRRNLDNFFKNVSKSRSEQRLWTCFKDDIGKIRSKNVSAKQWLASNARATNNYINTDVVAYLINKYVDPFYIAFFASKDIVIDQDEFALSEMLQWVFRSAIREGKPIQLYVPSERMRTLLYQFLNNEKIEFTGSKRIV